MPALLLNHGSEVHAAAPELKRFLHGAVGGVPAGAEWRCVGARLVDPDAVTGGGSGRSRWAVDAVRLSLLVRPPGEHAQREERPIEAEVVVPHPGQRVSRLVLCADGGSDQRSPARAQEDRDPWAGGGALAAGGAAELSPAGTVRRVQQLFDSLFRSMDQGAVAQWTEESLCEDFTHVMHHPETGTHVHIGRSGYCSWYNDIVDKYWGGPQSCVTWEPATFEYIAPGWARCVIWMEVSRGLQQAGMIHTVAPGVMHYKRRLQWEVALRGNLLRWFELWCGETLPVQPDRSGSGLSQTAHSSFTSSANDPAPGSASPSRSPASSALVAHSAPPPERRPPARLPHAELIAVARDLMDQYYAAMGSGQMAEFARSKMTPDYTETMRHGRFGVVHHVGIEAYLRHYNNLWHIMGGGRVSQSFTILNDGAVRCLVRMTSRELHISREVGYDLYLRGQKLCGRVVFVRYPEVPEQPQRDPRVVSRARSAVAVMLSASHDPGQFNMWAASVLPEDGFMLLQSRVSPLLGVRALYGRSTCAMGFLEWVTELFGGASPANVQWSNVKVSSRVYEDGCDSLNLPVCIEYEGRPAGGVGGYYFAHFTWVRDGMLWRHEVFWVPMPEPHPNPAQLLESGRAVVAALCSAAGRGSGLARFIPWLVDWAGEDVTAAYGGQGLQPRLRDAQSPVPHAGRGAVAMLLDERFAGSPEEAASAAKQCLLYGVDGVQTRVGGAVLLLTFRASRVCGVEIYAQAAHPAPPAPMGIPLPTAAGMPLVGMLTTPVAQPLALPAASPPAPGAVSTRGSGGGGGGSGGGDGHVPPVRPCDHNDWDSVRMKRGWAILRCRQCQRQWRICLSDWGKRCSAFITEAGCTDSGCGLLHVHRRRIGREGPAAGGGSAQDDGDAAPADDLDST
eukprot:TRINITY_DN3469_c0_g2_i2.p1 TRINITY_DN3469_c0_g2~~TRINITY_DN3469_c0_g2_i2.p1  ORF type:complete len:985 (+),score=241.06 TRINITY_DN3469_c0_g2_i2:247-2955(+)